MSDTSNQRQLCTHSVTTATPARVARTHRCTWSTGFRSSVFTPNPPGVAVVAAPHDAGHGSQLDAAAAFASVDGADQALRQGRQRAADAQQLLALLVVAAPKLHGRTLEHARRQREQQLRRRLQVMRARAAAVEDGASSGGIQYGADNAVKDLGVLCSESRNVHALHE